MLDSRTIRLYVSLLKLGRPVGVREFQRYVKLKNPGSAKYYLDKLVSLGLAERLDNGKYVAKVDRRSLLSIYTRLMGIVIPRLIPYAIGLTAFTIVYSYLIGVPILFLIPAILCLGVLWFEGLRLYRLLKKITS